MAGVSKSKRNLKPIALPPPLKLNLGSGPTKMDGFLSVDRIKFPTVDVVFDLAKKMIVERSEDLESGAKYVRLPTGYGKWPWKDDSVDEIHCSHTIEHFDAIERVHIFNEMFRVMKVGAKATLIAPHWASCRAYGDPTHKWPPLSEFAFYYLLKQWRMANASHTDIEYWPLGFKCDFDVTWGYSMHPEVQPRNQEYQQNALKFWKEAAQDVIWTMVKRG